MASTRDTPLWALTPAQAAERLHRRLGHYRLDTGLATLSRISVACTNPQVRQRMEHHLPELSIFPHQPLYIAKALLQLAKELRSGELTPEEFVECARLYNHAQEPDAPVDGDRATVERMLMRITQQQFPSQRWPMLRLIRSLLLFEDIARRPDVTARFDIPTAFEQLVGLSVEDFMFVGVCVWWKVWDGRFPAFQSGDIRSDVLPVLNPENVRRFLERTATDQAGFRRLCDKYRPPDPALVFYAYNPLEGRPIIATRRSGYVVPVPVLRLERVGAGVYYDLLDAHGNAFTNAFGYVFQEYVGELLRDAYDPDHGELYAERRYGPKKVRRDTADWIVIEGSSAVLIECKSRRLSLETKVSADPALIHRDLAAGIVDGVKGLRRTMTDILAGAAGLEYLPKLDTLVPVVLLLDPFPAANSLTIREMVFDQLRHAGIEPFDYQVLDVEELEQCLPAIKQRGFAHLLQEKMADADEQYPLSARAFWPFSHYVVEVIPAEERVRTPLLNRRWRVFGRGYLPGNSDVEQAPDS